MEPLENLIRSLKKRATGLNDEGIEKDLEELERLVGLELGAYRQTALDLNWSRPGVFLASVGPVEYLVRWDPMGRLLVKSRNSTPNLPRMGDTLYVGEDRARAKIASIDKLYEGSSVTAALCEVAH